MVRLNPRSLRVLNQDGASDMMHSVEGADHIGAFLRGARETTGRTVADVAQNLRIRRVHLEAIEDGRFDELPGAAYAVGFVRSYAAFLNLDAPALVERFKEEAGGIQAPQELEFPTLVPEGRFPGGLLVTICLLLAAAAFGGWYWYQGQNGIEIARVPPPPAEAPESEDAPVATPQPAVAPAERAPETATTDTAAAGESEPSRSGPVVETPMAPTEQMADVPVLAVGGSPEPDSVASSAPEESETAQPEVATESTIERMVVPNNPAFSSEPAITAIPETEETHAARRELPSDREGRTFGARNAAARIILRAQENTWVQVRDQDENVVLTQMFETGDRYMVPNRDGLRLMTGNAGGLEIRVDGETVPSIGERGESRRDVRLEPNLLRSGSAVVR